jgi:hypothetical protein
VAIVVPVTVAWWFSRMISIGNFDYIRHPIMRHLIEYWLQMSDEPGAMPPKQKLDPLNFPTALSYVWLVRRETGEPGDGEGVTKFRYLLAGESINTVAGFSYAKKFLAELFDAEMAIYMARRFTRMCDTPAVCHDIGRIYTYTEKSGQGERLMMPLAGKNGAVEFIFGCTNYDWDQIMRTPEQPSDGHVTTFTDLPNLE